MLRLLRLVVLLGTSTALHAAELTLPALFTNHMILQREAAVPVWGWAGAGEEIIVEFAGQTKTAKADVSGKWMVKLEPLAASAEPREMRIGARVINDVIVGDVWLCSGQSNMTMAVSDSADAEQETAAATFPALRIFTVTANPTLTPAPDVKGQWDRCSPQTIGNFSATAYYFGRGLHRELNVPIGLLHSSVGGTPAEAWTRLGALRTLPPFAQRADKEIAEISRQQEDNRQFLITRAAWEEKFGVQPPPIAVAAQGWAAASLDTKEWKTVTLPARWANLGAKTGGVFWLRKEVVLPAAAAGQPFSLSLNWISEQYDTAFFNGIEVGRADHEAPNFYNKQRSYRIPATAVKAGRNVIAVRIVSATHLAGMWQWGHALGLPVADRGAIDNEWLMKTESLFPPLSAAALQARPKVNNLPFRNVSAALYNGMIHPLIPFGLKGAVWYQGESNAPRHQEYRALMSLLIGDWRAQWGQGDFPFVLQQLVNNGAPAKDPQQPGSWPLLREAQTQIIATVPNTSLAIGIELGDPLTIHPKNKQAVGQRLALVALEKVYARAIESSGPRFISMKIEGATIRLQFTHATGLTAPGGRPKNFLIAGADQKFAWADAQIFGETVIVSSPQVPQPSTVRYAWADNPAGCNLTNGAGLPAAPFRTDEPPINSK